MLLVALLASNTVLVKRSFKHMARKTITTLIDDVDGTEADRTVSFSLDGTSYEIDLSRNNIDALTAALEPFTTAGRKLTRRSSTRPSSSGTGIDLAEVRRWARDQGMEVSGRGRFSKEIMEAYTRR